MRIYEDEDLYFAVLPDSDVGGVRVVVRYLVVADDRERLVIVRDFA